MSLILSQQSRGVFGSGSPLLRQGRGGSKKKDLGFSINLTTLIDAFCILVIFLLANMNTQAENIDVSQKITLPSATQTELLTMGTVVKIEAGIIFIDNKQVSKEELVKALLEKRKASASETDEKKKDSLIIQADRQSDFDQIGDILRAGGQTGFTNYMFAVLPGGITADLSGTNN